MKFFHPIQKLDAEDLKSRCLDQLEIISKKRLLSIIKGEEMNSSSSESEHESTNVADVLQENPIVEASQSAADTQEVGKLVCCKINTWI